MNGKLELKPCPFCGCAAEMEIKGFDVMRGRNFSTRTEYYVTCIGCGAQVWSCLSASEARRRWNRRESPAKQPCAKCRSFIARDLSCSLFGEPCGDYDVCDHFQRREEPAAKTQTKNNKAHKAQKESKHK